MNGFMWRLVNSNVGSILRSIVRVSVLALLMLSLVRCATPASTYQDESDVQAQSKDEFNGFEDDKNAGSSPVDQSLEEDLKATDAAPPAAPLEEPPKEAALENSPVPEVTEPPAVAEVPAPPPEVTEPAAPPVSSNSDGGYHTTKSITLKSIQYKANDNGGTIVIDADGEMTYSTRLVRDTKQFIIEIPNSILPRRLTRNLNTRDFEGIVGSIDAYQNPGSNLSRIVVQLRDISQEPQVQSEGHSILVVANQATVSPVTSNEQLQSKLLSYDSLESFLTGNMTFYGKRISIETNDMELRDVFKLISEESGVNMIISDEIKGKASIKLKNVPWDQALVMIMKSRKISYTRMGNVLRIAPINDIRMEEDDAIKLAEAKKDTAPLKVRLVPVSFAKLDELEKQIKPFLGKRGSVIADPRTSSVVISDIDENLDRVAKLIQSIDVPPQQVLIEGKIVEALDDFTSDIGVSWSSSGRRFNTGAGSSTGNVRGLAGLSVGSPGTGALGLNLQLGTLDILGDLTATLALNEHRGNVKVLSSPRIVALHNQPAEISQVTQIPYSTATTNGSGNAVPTTNFKDVALKLAVTPQITNSGSVIMSVEMKREFTGAKDKTATAPPINSRTANTKIMVKNGQTAVIGGIFQSDSNDGTTQVPWLGDIPIVGWLFKSKSKSSQKNELLIFLTPKILSQLDGAPGSEQKETLQ